MTSKGGDSKMAKKEDAGAMRRSPGACDDPSRAPAADEQSVGGREDWPESLPMPSASQEDYLETILQLERERDQVILSDIAERLGVARPPATRAVQALQRMGFVEHEARRDVSLTPIGRRIAEALAHRHADLVFLLTEILGVPAEVAEADTCQMEHGLSPLTAQRLHEFLEHYATLDEKTRAALRAGESTAEFEFLPKGKQAGWRA